MSTITAGPRMIPLAELRDMLASVMMSREYLAAEPAIRYGENGWQQPARCPPVRGCG